MVTVQEQGEKHGICTSSPHPAAGMIEDKAVAVLSKATWLSLWAKEHLSATKRIIYCLA